MTEQILQGPELYFSPSVDTDWLGSIYAVALAHKPKSHKFMDMWYQLTARGLSPTQIQAQDLIKPESEFNKEIEQPSLIASGKAIQVAPDYVGPALGQIEVSAANDIVVRKMEKTQWVDAFKLAEPLTKKGREFELVAAIAASLGNGGVRRVQAGDAVIGRLDDNAVGFHGFKEMYWSYRQPLPEEIALYLWGSRAAQVVRKDKHLKKELNVKEMDKLYWENLATAKDFAKFKEGYLRMVPQVNDGVDWLSDIIGNLKTNIDGIERGKSGFEEKEEELNNLLLGKTGMRIQMMEEAVSVLNSGKHIRGDEHVTGVLEQAKIPSVIPVPIAWVQMFAS